MSEDFPRYTTERVDRSYLAPRNERIIEALMRGHSYQQVADKFSLSRGMIKSIAYNTIKQSNGMIKASTNYRGYGGKK